MDLGLIMVFPMPTGLVQIVQSQPVGVEEI
jgi:hypothetical protein